MSIPDPLEGLNDALAILGDVAEFGRVPKTAAIEVLTGGADKAKPTKPNKQTNLEKVGGRQQEFIANALIATDTAMPILLKALRSGKVKFRSGEAVASALARMGLAQAELAKMLDGAPHNLEDTGALERELLEAVGKLTNT